MRRSRIALEVLALTLALSAGAAAQNAPAAAPAGGGGGGTAAGSPYLAKILRDDLYADVWERPGLAPRDRSLITIAITQSLYATEEIRAHIGRGLNNGLTQAQISELIAHVLVYAGFPTGVNAARVAREVYAQRNLPSEVTASPRNRDPVVPPAYPNSFPQAPYLEDLLNEWVYGEVWERPDLSKRDRSLATIAVAQGMGAESELRSHIARGLDNGVTQEEIGELITHIAYYTGIPAAVNAARVAAAVFEQRNLPMPRSDIPAAPYLDNIIDGLLADTWDRSPLTDRERTLITMAVMQTVYSTAELRTQMDRALAMGITADEISEMIAHVTLYAGFPMGVNAARQAGAAFQARGVTPTPYAPVAPPR